MEDMERNGSRFPREPRRTHNARGVTNQDAPAYPRSTCVKKQWKITRVTSKDPKRTSMGKTQDTAVLEAHEDLAALRPGLKVPGYFLALLIAVTLVAALLRFYGLGNRGFWLDETFSLDPPHQTETNMAFYYLLLRLWVKLGTSEVFVRTMSVVFSVATVPLLYAVGERLFGRKAGLLAAWLLALNAFHIHYAQEARAYALVVLMGTVATYLLVRNIQQPERATWLLYGAFLALSVYSHLFAVFLVAALAACLLCLPRRAIPW